MQLRQLEIFLAVLEHSGVTAAAAKVGLSPGAVSLQLRSLSEELHTDLFVRRGRRLEPTLAAANLAERAAAVVARLRDIEREFLGTPEDDTRPFRLATGATTLMHRLGPLLRTLRRKYPHTEMVVTVCPTEDMVAGLLDGRFDLAVISLPYSDEGLRIMPLFEEELVVLRPSAQRVRGWHVGTVDAAELASASFLLYPRRSNMRALIERFFDQLGIRPKVVMEADDTEAIKRLVEYGFGYSVLPEYALRRGPKLFQVLRVPGQPIFRRQALAMARTGRLRPLTEVIAAFLQSELCSSDAHRAYTAGRSC